VVEHFRVPSVQCERRILGARFCYVRHVNGEIDAPAERRAVTSKPLDGGCDGGRGASGLLVLAIWSRTP
jgi:hypothetical protein